MPDPGSSPSEGRRKAAFVFALDPTTGGTEDNRPPGNAFKERRMRITHLAAAALFGWLGTARADLQLEPLTLADQTHSAQPSVAADPAGGFVLTWQERAGDRTVLAYALIGADGKQTRRGEIASGTDWFVNGADFPSLAVLDNGDWVSFWLQKTAPDTYAYAIRSTRSRDRGTHWEPPVTLHRDGTDTEHGFVSMAAAGADRVRFTWLDGRRMAGIAGPDHEGAGEHMTLRTATLGRDGRHLDERELDDLTCACCQTDVARGATRTVVVYRNRSAAEIRDIQALSWSAGRWRAAQAVHADGWKIAGCPVNGPAITARGDRFTVLWPTMAGGGMQLQLAHGDGTRFGAPVEVAAGAAELGRVDLVTWGRDGFLASRLRQDEDGTMALQLDALDADGRSVSSTTVARKVGGFPRMARHGEIVLLAWAEAGSAPGRSRVGLARIHAGATAASAAPAR